jgi:hypothetical protein
MNTIRYHNRQVLFSAVECFRKSARRDNGTRNDMRETIIGAVINKKIPETWYEDDCWRRLRDGLDHYIEKLIGKKERIQTIECVHKGGRKYHYDFVIIINGMPFNIEFKFNAAVIKDTPQFANVMRPSRFLSNNYEEYYFDKYLSSISNKYSFDMPERDVYLKTIHSNNPLCMKEYQEMYYRGCEKSSKFSGDEKDIQFYREAKDISKESIKTFIQQTDLDMKLLSEYLKNEHTDKIYMLFKDGEFNIQYPNVYDYDIQSYTKTDTSYIAKTTSNKTLKILLRWKNGLGIAFPAFQIS